MWVSVDSKTKSYQIYSGIVQLFIFLHQPSIFLPLQSQTYWHYDDRGVQSDGGLFDKMSLVIITITIDLIFIVLINFWVNSLYSWIAYLGHQYGYQNSLLFL